MFVLSLKVCALVVGLSLFGWAVSAFLLPRRDGGHPLLHALYVFLAGFGVASSLLFLLAFFGVFQVWLALALFALFAAALLIWKRSAADTRTLRTTIVCCFAILTIVFALHTLSPPYQAFLGGDDASIYLAAAVKIGKEGKLFLSDDVLQQTRLQERERLFFNRFRNDSTGHYMRFPGGVRILDTESGTVTFAFYHLFPVWLAFGYQIMGAPDFLLMMNLFAAVSLISIGMIGWRLAGPLAGICAAVVFFFFYPQVFFSRMPVSEILAQALFLSGLAAFLAEDQRIRQWLAGILWGALMITRVEAILLVPVALLFIFTIEPWLTKERHNHRPLVLILLAFALLAVLHQVRTGQYLVVDFPTGTSAAIVEPIFNGLRTSSQIMQDHPGVIPAILAAVLFSVAWIWRKQTMVSLRTIRLLLIATCIIAVAAFVLFLPKAKWTYIVIRLNWLTPYTGVWLFMALLSGIMALLFFRNQRIAAFRCLIFLLLSSLVFLLSPILMSVHQPWATRRFVPMAFPLLFVTGISGWRLIVRTLFRNHRLHNLMFLALSLGAAAFLFSLSKGVFTAKLYEDVYDQSRRLAAELPQKSVVLLPDGLADLHTQVALQFLFDRNVLLIPLHRSKSFLKDSLHAYLDRQLVEGIPVLMMSNRRSPSYPLLDDYRLQFQQMVPLQFNATPRGLPTQIPDAPVSISIGLRLFKIIEKSPAPMKTVLSFDDPDLIFSGFYAQTNSFRWTTRWSDIGRFRFPTGNKPVVMKLTVGRAAAKSGDWANASHWRIFVNDWIRAEFLRKRGDDFYFRVPPLPEKKIVRVSITSKTFVRKTARNDSELGIPFARIEFLPE